jgi:hypothetical protein
MTKKQEENKLKIIIVLIAIVIIGIAVARIPKTAPPEPTATPEVTDYF